MNAPAPPSPSSPWGLGGWALVAAAFTVGFVNFPLQVVGTGFDHLPGDVIDNRLNNFVLEHGYRYLAGMAGSFWDAPAFYPSRGATKMSDAHLGMLPVYAACRALGASPEHAFQGWFLVPFVLNFFATVWAVRRLGYGALAASVAAYVFAFGLPVVAQLTHAQLFPRFLVPPAVVFAWEGLRAPRTWRLAAVAGCVGGQIILSVYIGYFLVLLLAAGLLVALARFGRQLPWAELLRPGKAAWARRGGVVLLAAAPCAALLTHHAHGTGQVSMDILRDFAPQPASWVTPPPGVAYASGVLGWTPLSTRLMRTNEMQLGSGLLPVVAVIIGALLLALPTQVGNRRAVVVVGAGAALLIAVTVTRIGDVWLYAPVAATPGPSGIRVIARVVLVLLFPAAVALGVGVEAAARAMRRLGRVPMCVVAGVALAAVAAEQRLVSIDGEHAGEWYPFRCPVSYCVERQARVADAIRQHPSPRFVYAFPSGGNGRDGVTAFQVEVMRAAQDLGVPSVNGYSGYMPYGWDSFPDHRGLLTWLMEFNHFTPEQLRGLVLLGDPQPDADPRFDAAGRIAHPPTPLR